MNLDRTYDSQFHLNGTDRMLLSNVDNDADRTGGKQRFSSPIIAVIIADLCLGTARTKI